MLKDFGNDGKKVRQWCRLKRAIEGGNNKCGRVVECVQLNPQQGAIKRSVSIGVTDDRARSVLSDGSMDG